MKRIGAYIHTDAFQGHHHPRGALLPSQKEKRKRARAGTTFTRFSKDGSGRLSRRAKIGLKRRKYSGFEIQAALDLAAKIGLTAAAKQLGILRWTLESWTQRGRLPTWGKYTHAKVMPVVATARSIYRRTGTKPILALKEAWRLAGMNLSSLKVYLSLEQIPTFPDFVIYSDPDVQAACVARANPEAQPVVSPKPRAPAKPAAPQEPPAQGSALQDKRRDLNFGFQLGSTSGPDMPRRRAKYVVRKYGDFSL